MSLYQYPGYPQSVAPTPTPTPTPLRSGMTQWTPRRWVRVCVFPRNTQARLRYVPLRPQSMEQIREVALTQSLWSCRTSFHKYEVVRVKYSWEQSWDYYEIKFAIPIIPGFGRSNVALLRLQECPEFVGEIVVVRRTGHRLSLVADMRIEDHRKVEIAVTSAVRTAMNLDGTYRGNIIVQYMISCDALDHL